MPATACRNLPRDGSGNPDHPALAVGVIGVISSIPMLLMPLGGVIADQADRRRILIVG